MRSEYFRLPDNEAEVSQSRMFLLQESLSRTLQFEGKIIRQVSTLMVTTKQEERGGVPNFERPQIEHALCGWIRSMGIQSRTNSAYLDTEVPSVNVVSQEEIPRGSGVAADFEKFHQVVLVMSKFRMCAQAREGRKGHTYCP